MDRNAEIGGKMITNLRRRVKEMSTESALGGQSRSPEESRHGDLWRVKPQIQLQGVLEGRSPSYKTHSPSPLKERSQTRLGEGIKGER